MPNLSFDKLRPFEALRSPQALEEMVSLSNPFRHLERSEILKQVQDDTELKSFGFIK